VGLRNTTTEWGSLAKALHWLIAIGIFVLIYLGLEQAGMERGDEKKSIRFIHASIASGVFFLMTLRLIWRWMNETPAHPDGIAPVHKLTANIVHWGLYVTVFIQLVSGAMTVATNGSNLPFFGLFSVPLPVAENHDAHEFWEGIHEPAWIAVAVLIGIHILGALYNHFVVKNNVLRRMTHGVK
jgi:cytochrome b561